LTAAFAKAQAAWPEVPLAPERFAAHLGATIGPAAPDEAARLIDQLRIPELYLAAACAHGDAIALAAFESRYLSSAETALSRLSLDSATRSEVFQALRIRLFTEGDGRRRILDYSGRGELAGWVRVAAVRIALNLRRSTKRERPLFDELLAALPSPADDPSRAHLKETYKKHVGPALEAAFGALSVRERNLLRQHYVDGLRIGELAVAYGVHRVTASRWLETARESLIDGLRSRLGTALGIDQAEVASLLDLVHSRLDVSLGQLARQAG
jgi:RNA polymerase sigma-70 factor (ECF subfamily)